MSKTDNKGITFDILMTDYKYIKEENKLLEAEKQNLFHENTNLKILIDKSKRSSRSIFWLSWLLLISLFVQQYLYSKVKEENLRLKSQISNERMK